jgi:hypothetical protein
LRWKTFNGTANFSLRFADRELNVFFFQDEVPLTAPRATPKPKPINLEECILCQKKKRSEYLSSGEIGRVTIVLLAKQTKTNDTRAARVLQLTMQEQGIIKYHTSSCYRIFQRDMAKTDSITQPLEQLNHLYSGLLMIHLSDAARDLSPV